MKLAFGLSNPSDVLAKMQREKRRLHSALDAGDFSEIGDMIFNFSVTAYHLKDWIKKDKSHPEAGQKVEGFVHGRAELQACRDICNESKHFGLNYEPDTEDVIYSAPPPTEMQTALPELDCGKKLEGHVKIRMLDGSKLEVRQFADDVSLAWHGFFDDNDIETET